MRIMCLAASLVVALLCLELRLGAQKQGQLFLSFTGQNGAAITDLQAGDVSVSEDGVDCKILKLESVNWPIKLHVLVDNGKPNTNPINPLRDGLKGLFDAMPDGIEMDMYSIAGAPRPVVKPTTDRQKLVDGIGLISPDSGTGMFFDGLFEAVSRIDKDKAPNFPVILVVGSDLGRASISDRDYMKLQEIIIKRAVTVHIIMMNGAAGVNATGGGPQTEVGLYVTKLSGGRYDNINSPSRLATLLPELGKKIADANAHQLNQYRVTYERPANAKDQSRISAAVKRDGTPSLSIDGKHLQ
jgi:hypothetical protein